ncbi:MAG: ATP-binding cassette domain-containing protein [Tissierellia bacterium]|nr:ATP-binding cassette domain-containing protein [Tissierellia bacterium]
MKSIKIEKLNFGYTEEVIIKDLNLHIDSGEMAVLVGENGSGKSTLVKLILGELSQKSGSIHILGEDIKTKNSYKEIGYVPQMNIMEKIAFPVTCLELISLGLYEDFGFIKIPRKRHKEKVIEMLKTMDLEEYQNVPFNELSGGLQQRVMICRSLIHEPKIILMDEPTSGVDQESKEKFLKLTDEINKKFGITIILVTHELEFVMEILELNHYYKMKNGGVEIVRV